MGVGLAVIDNVEVLEQFPVETVSVYVVGAFGVTITEEVVCPVFQEYAVALVLALSVTFVPLQTVLAEAEMLTVGVATNWM